MHKERWSVCLTNDRLRIKVNDIDVLLLWADCINLRSPHLQTELQAVPVLSSLYPSLISFASLTFPGAPYKILLLFIPWLPCHFYPVVIEQQQIGRALAEGDAERAVHLMDKEISEV